MSDDSAATRFRAYSYRLKTTPRVEALFRRFAGCRRYVYNRALALQKERYRTGQKRLGYAGLCRELTGWKRDPETVWLQEAPLHVLRQALMDLCRSYADYFEGRSGLPSFRKKGKSVESFRESDPAVFAVDSAGGRVKLPKTGWVRYRNSRPIEGSPRQVTVSCRDGKWYVSVITKQVSPAPVHRHPGVGVGIDVGVNKFAAMSDGRAVPPLNAHRRIESMLIRLHRSLARKVKFSANWKKQKGRIAKLNGKAANCRRDYLHKLSTTISKNHAVVVVEDLRVKSMTASARGTAEKPGRNVRQKAGLNKAILDQGWGEFVRQLGYKCEWAGGRLVKVNPAYTSQTCSACGHCESGNRPSQAVFRCLRCGHEANADANAARNILAAGQAVNACGVSGSGPGAVAPV